MRISKVKIIRENLGYTQAELAEQSNLSIRTIQRLESGRNHPKGHTLKVLAKALKVEPIDLQVQVQVQVQERDIITSQDQAADKLKMLNLSTLCFIGIPFGNLLIPFLIWNRHRSLRLVDEVGRKIISFQIIWTLCTIFLLILSPFLQLYLHSNISIMLILGLIAVAVNLFFIFKTAGALLRQDYDGLPLKIQII